jgi:hypothetical protein
MRLNFAMMQHHNYSMSDLDEMLPWEHQVYVDMLLGYLEDERQKAKDEALRNR